MRAQKNSQQTPNSGVMLAAASMIVDIREALWRLQITPSAAELCSMVAPQALIGRHQINLCQIACTRHIPIPPMQVTIVTPY